jgi:photosystem II stability/assembly factor-like uncharacterized protein
MKIFLGIVFCLSAALNINAQWQPTNGPEGGLITGFTEKDNYIFATEGDYHSGSVYRSSDDGNSWEFISEGLPLESTITSPTFNQNYVFIGTKNKGVFRSSDLGMSWEQVSNGIPINYASIYALITINDTIFAGTSFYGMYKSIDNGENWVEINNGLTGDARYIKTVYKFNNIIFIGTLGGLYRSYDYGNSWQPSDNGIPSNKFPIQDIYSQDNILFAVGLNTFYKSSDNGDSWQSISGVPNPNSVYSFGGNLYAGSYQGLYKSTDYGESWSLLNSGLPQYSNVTEIFENNNSLLVSVSILGVYKFSAGGNEWIPSSIGIQNTSPLCMNVKDDSLYSGTFDSDYGVVWQYDYNNNSWIQRANGLSPIGCNTLYSNSQFIFAGTDGSGIFRSSDNGLNWEQAGSQFSFAYVSSLEENNDYLFTGLFGFSIDVYRSSDNGDNWEATSVPGSGDITFIYNYDNYIFTGRTSGVYRTSDSGTTWVPVNNGLQSSPFASVFTQAGNYIFVNCNDGIYRSSDHGDNWTKLNNFPNYQIYSLTHSGDNIFAGTRYNGLFYSTDFGESWDGYSDGLPILSFGSYPSIHSLQVLNGNLYAGLEGLGIWFNSLSFIPVELISFTANITGNKVELNWVTATEKNNKGFEIEKSQKSEVKRQMNWEKVGYVPGNGTTTESQSYSFTDNSVQSGKYLYRLKQIDFDGTYEYSDAVEVEVNIPLQFSLSQNYPNPFNPSTKIKYSVPATANNKAGLVTLTIYDILGNEVETLVNKIQSSGEYEVTFKANNLSSGIYFYRLSSGSYSQIKKMILMK